MDMIIDTSHIIVEVKGSIFYDRLKQFEDNNLVKEIGDPLTSAIACIISRSTNNPVIIENLNIVPNENIVKSIYKILL